MVNFIFRFPTELFPSPAVRTVFHSTVVDCSHLWTPNSARGWSPGTVLINLNDSTSETPFWWPLGHLLHATGKSICEQTLFQVCDSAVQQHISNWQEKKNRFHSQSGYYKLGTMEWTSELEGLGKTKMTTHWYVRIHVIMGEKEKCIKKVVLDKGDLRMRNIFVCNHKRLHRGSNIRYKCRKMWLESFNLGKVAWTV